MSESQPSVAQVLPLLPLRDVVVFPHMVIPLFVGRPKSIKALEAAMEGGKSIMLVAQKNASKDEPTAADIHQIGCLSGILQMLKLPDGTVKVLVGGRGAAELTRFTTMARTSSVKSPRSSSPLGPPRRLKRCGAPSSRSLTNT